MRRTAVALFVATGMVLMIRIVHGANGPVLPQLISSPPTFSVSTVPANGDVNPYGVAFVPEGFPHDGVLNAGDILVSNFNAISNLQGTGSTIVRIDPTGHQSLFFQGSARLGLTTALGVLSAGFVIVGNVPTTRPNATCTQEPSGEETGVSEGSLLILDRNGRLIQTLRSHQFLDGPWDLTVRDNGATAQVFVSNVRAGTVTRLDVAVDANAHGLRVVNTTQVASGYTHRCDPNALVVGPTGVALDPSTGTLFVASTGDNAIYAVSDAATATVDQGPGTPLMIDAVHHLHGSLALVRAPNGDLIASQGDAVNPDAKQPSEIVEFTAAGGFVTQFSIDQAAGSAFGLALEPRGNGFRFAAVDDGTNMLDIWVVP
jgi:hypothetical protein